MLIFYSPAHLWFVCALSVNRPSDVVALLTQTSDDIDHVEVVFLHERYAANRNEIAPSRPSHCWEELLRIDGEWPQNSSLVVHLVKLLHVVRPTENPRA